MDYSDIICYSIAKYLSIAEIQHKILTLNKILSQYEDKMASLESQFFDLSFKFKQLHAATQSQEEIK